MITISSGVQAQTIRTESNVSAVTLKKNATQISGSMETGVWPNVTIYDVTPTINDTVQKLGDPTFDFENEIDTLITF